VPSASERCSKCQQPLTAEGLAVARGTTMKLRAEANAATIRELSRQLQGPAVWVSEARTVLVTRHQDGTMTVATRSEPDARWGPPVTVHPEGATE
jgi:hypothetical protein